MKNICLAMIACAALAGPLAADDDRRTISVNGNGSVETAPDMATVSIGVTHEAKQAGAAMDAVSASVTQVLARLEEAGVEGRDIQTSGLSLNPVWSDQGGPSGRQITGYEARNGVVVRVREIADLGGILDRVVADGANTLGGIRFGLQNPDPLMDEARRRAVADGRATAQLLADAAGVALGPLASMSDHGGNGGGPRPMEMRLSASSDMPVAQGEISLTASVSMVYLIAE